jgi:hypothetical protein
MAYQACAKYDDGRQRHDYTKFRSDHRGTVVLLPHGANPRWADECNFLMAAAFCDERWDSQQGRTLDFGIPRQLPDRLLLHVAAFAVVPFLELGMAARVDVECCTASDGQPNGHAHVWISQRLLEADGFGSKCRSWNRLFRLDGGRYVRSLIACRVTLACAMLGIAAHVDPRRNDERGLGTPEPRIASKLWRKHNAGSAVPVIEELKKGRGRRKPGRSTATGPAPLDGSASPYLVLRCAYLQQDVESQRARVQVVASQAVCRGCTVKIVGHMDHVTFGSDYHWVGFDGATFVAEHADANLLEFIARLTRQMDWPALLVDGARAAADDFILAAAKHRVTAVNRHASARTLQAIRSRYAGRMVEEIAPFDLLGVVESPIGLPHGSERGALRSGKEKTRRPMHDDDLDLVGMPHSPNGVDVDGVHDNDHGATEVLDPDPSPETDEIPGAKP